MTCVADDVAIIVDGLGVDGRITWQNFFYSHNFGKVGGYPISRDLWCWLTIWPDYFFKRPHIVTSKIIISSWYLLLKILLIYNLFLIPCSHNSLNGKTIFLILFVICTIFNIIQMNNKSSYFKKIQGEIRSKK